MPQRLQFCSSLIWLKQNDKCNQALRDEGNIRMEQKNWLLHENPPRLKNLVYKYLMGDVWIRDTPFGPVTDSLVLAKKFNLQHGRVLRAISKCQKELRPNVKFELEKHLIEASYFAGPKGKERSERKVEITEFGLVLLLLYINSPTARQISAEIVYSFLILQTYLKGLTKNQIGALRGYYRKKEK